MGECQLRKMNDEAAFESEQCIPQDLPGGPFLRDAKSDCPPPWQAMVRCNQCVMRIVGPL